MALIAWQNEHGSLVIQNNEPNERHSVQVEINHDNLCKWADFFCAFAQDEVTDWPHDLPGHLVDFDEQ